MRALLAVGLVLVLLITLSALTLLIAAIAGRLPRK